jgi:hypothetical protein
MSKKFLRFSFFCVIIFVIHVDHSEAQFSLLQNIPIFSDILNINNNDNSNNSSLKSQTRPKKASAVTSATLTPRGSKCCEMVQVTSQSVGNIFLPGKNEVLN